MWRLRRHSLAVESHLRLVQRTPGAVIRVEQQMLAVVVDVGTARSTQAVVSALEQWPSGTGVWSGDGAGCCIADAVATASKAVRAKEQNPG